MSLGIDSCGSEKKDKNNWPSIRLKGFGIAKNKQASKQGNKTPKHYTNDENTSGWLEDVFTSCIK